ncbi:metal-dependent hydrolase [Eisenibacter elegans]|jgi:L-ascorbate metabolism protein UlaG (beta-lactamase superfamily)|uniref:metal-dependent hydrolase n=1 Tax=Eisenibacter elegans TaxID=997 RepID=UPI00041B1681|nr:metal-dependent hydrolase [Eisenibacter elegans]
MKITYYGHSCVAVETQGKTILFDPFIKHNPLAAHIDVAQLRPDYVLLTHGHADHVADAAEIALQADATLVSNFEVVEWFAKQGVQKNHPMNHGGSWNFDFGKVKYVHAVHSSTLPDGSPGGNPGGFILWGDKTIYHAGDTALTLDMQLIPRFAQLDLALLPIGDNFTMGVEDAIIAADFIGCNKVLGIHYDTFGYIKIDPQAAKEAFAAKGKELILLHIGESLSL